MTSVYLLRKDLKQQLEKYSDRFLQILYSKGISKTSTQGGMNPIVRVVVSESSLIKKQFNAS